MENAAVVRDLSDTLLDFLRPGGTLLLSGLLQSQAAELCEYYVDRIELAVAEASEGWVCLQGKLPSA